MKLDPFAAWCEKLGFPVPEPEHRFHPERKWRIDYAWPRHKIALEIEGGAFRGGGHRSVGKFLRDMEKYNELSIAGWRLLRVTTKDLESGDVVALLERVLPRNGVVPICS